MILEQIPKRIHRTSSQYGSDRAQNYAVGNICNDVQIYPTYGDSVCALVFRTYGPWWINLPSYREHHRAYCRPEINFTSRDFVEIEFENYVYQGHSLDIYETYNPGSVEVVYIGKDEADGNITWHEVWRFPQDFRICLRNNDEILVRNGHQQMKDLFPNHINSLTSSINSLHLNTDNQLIEKLNTKHSYPPAARFPRIQKIPLDHFHSFPFKFIRIEFDHSTANYYIEIDTIRLCGDTSSKNHSYSIQKPISNKSIEQTNFDLTKLPFDILFLINSYLDLRSLVRLSSTCRYLHEQCLHSLQFRSLDLQPYWNKITNQSIEQFFSQYCSQTRWLSLAWTQSIHIESFQRLLSNCSKNLMQLDLSSCQYLAEHSILTIVDCCPNIQILNLENCPSLTNYDFLPLQNLSHIRSLNVYRTNIDFRTLLPLIYRNQEHFEYINLGACRHLINVVDVVKMLFGRCKNLRTIDLWRANELSANGFLIVSGLDYNHIEEENRLMALPDDIQEDLLEIYSIVDMPFEIQTLEHLKCLQEIDFGWTHLPAGFIKNLIEQVGSSLIKIFLTACRFVSNEDIYAIGEHCHELCQLDILGSNVIQPDAVECILKSCQSIEFIDLSFCSHITDEIIRLWCLQYKNCFKRSYTPINNDDIFMEFP